MDRDVLNRVAIAAARDRRAWWPAPGRKAWPAKPQWQVQRINILRRTLMLMMLAAAHLTQFLDDTIQSYEPINRT
jgi:hypothetical protein